MKLSDDWIEAVQGVCRAHPELLRSARTGDRSGAAWARFRLYHLAWEHRQERLADGRLEAMPIGDLKAAIFGLIDEHTAQSSAVDQLAELVL